MNGLCNGPSKNLQRYTGTVFYNLCYIIFISIFIWYKSAAARNNILVAQYRNLNRLNN